MRLMDFKPVWIFLKISIVLYILHKLLFYFLESVINSATFYHSIETLYFFFVATGIIILLISIFVKQKSLDNVGMTFLLATNINIVFCYLLLRPILAMGTARNNNFDKFNFFGMFILFLTVETIIVIRLLNKK